MKSLVRPALVLLLTAAAAAPAAAQQDARARERAAAERARAERLRPGRPAALHEDAERRAFDMLLRHRRQLELTDPQVRRLEEIRARLEQQNAPLRQRLVEEHQRWQAERRAQLERMSVEERRRELRRLRQAPGEARLPEPLQATVRQMRLHINEAMHQAQGVLTPEQRLRARELLARPAGPARRPRMQPGRRPARQQLEHQARVLQRRARMLEQRARMLERPSERRP